MAIVDVRQIQIGSWQFWATDAAFLFPESACRQAERYIQHWRRVFPYEPNYAQRECRVPSLLLRADCTVLADGSLGLYELDEHPAGLGFLQELRPETRDLLRDWKEQFPGLAYTVSPRRLGDCCDCRWLPRLTSDAALHAGRPLFVRTAVEDEGHCLPQLQHLAALSHATEGQKGYGVPLGLWTLLPLNGDPITPPHLAELGVDWDEPQAFKANGSRCKRVMFWHPDGRVRRSVGGYSTQTKICNRLEQEPGPWYRQPLLLPQTFEHAGETYYWIYRVFWAWYRAERAYKFIGGVWCARPRNILNHGTSESIFGPVNVVP